MIFFIACFFARPSRGMSLLGFDGKFRCKALLSRTQDSYNYTRRSAAFIYIYAAQRRCVQWEAKEYDKFDKFDKYDKFDNMIRNMISLHVYWEMGMNLV
jgi:hypothetical protein